MGTIRKMILPVLVIGLCVSFWFFVGSPPVESDEPERPQPALSIPRTEIRLPGHAGSVKAYAFPILALKPEDDYYALTEPVPLIPKKTPLDEQGVPMFQADDQKLYNHPVRLAHHAILFVNSYQLTKNPAYLEKAKTFARRLMDIGVKEENRLYFPYEFDVYLHRIPSEHLAPPWYSGMAQGQALSAFSRLYQVTGDPQYLKAAEEVFNSLVHVKGEDGTIWVSMVDDQRYFWIEEYPMETPTHVLNGYLFAIFGLYDYYQVVKTEPVKHVLFASLTTIHDHVHRYRVPGQISRYGLKHDHQSKTYHQVHIDQLEVLYKMTGVSRFAEMKHLFEQDGKAKKKQKRG